MRAWRGLLFQSTRCRVLQRADLWCCRRHLQVVPLYLAEMAPAQSRGTMNVLFQLMITIGWGPAQAQQFKPSR
jgi:hypothetical protein